MHASFNFIYIIIFIAFIFFEILKKQAKKEKATVSETDSTDNQDSLPESWKNLMPKNVEHPSKRPLLKKDTSKNTVKSFLNFEEEGKRNNISSSEVHDEEKATCDISDTGENDYDFQSIDDVRKAVIWSEIINRKYK